MVETSGREQMRRVALSRVKDDFSKFLRMAEREEVIITRHGRPAGVMIGFRSEDDWFDYRLENDPRFLRRIAAARQSLRAGRRVRLEHVAARGSLKGMETSVEPRPERT